MSIKDGEIVVTKKAKELAEKITEDNEQDYLGAIREYYREEFKNGFSQENFITWITDQYGGID